MKAFRLNFLFWIAICITSEAMAQSTPPCFNQIFVDTLLNKLSGHWQGDGIVGGDTVHYSIDGSWELNHQFFLLQLVDESTPPHYIAHVYIGYDCPQNQYIVHWLDNFGGQFSETLGHAGKGTTHIDFLFDYPEGLFKNIFSYNRDMNTWNFHSTSKNTAGEWTLFGDIQLHR